MSQKKQKKFFFGKGGGIKGGGRPSPQSSRHTTSWFIEWISNTIYCISNTKINPEESACYDISSILQVSSLVMSLDITERVNSLYLLWNIWIYECNEYVHLWNINID